MNDASEELIDMIYAATLGEVDWHTFLDRFTLLAGVESATIFLHNSVSGRGSVTLASGIPEEAQREYAAYFGQLNPWMWQVGRTPVGEAIVGEQLIPRDRFVRTEYYNDFLRRYDQETGVGVTIERDNGRFFLMSTLGGDVDEERNAKRARLLTRLAPHLRRASAFYRRQVSDGPVNKLTDRLADLSGVATILVDIMCRPVLVGGDGEAILNEGDPIGITASGTVVFRSSAVQDALWQMLRDKGAPRSATFADDRREITLLALARDSASVPLLGAMVAVIIGGKAARVQIFAARHRLTPAEVRVTAFILQGQKPKEIARDLGLSVETVRSQLKAVFAKTGAVSQADLVRIAADGTM